MDENKDRLERRCPRLGGPVSFKYCRESGEDGIPCWKIIDCWWEGFDVVAFLREQLPGEQFDRLVNTRPKPKISSLVELVEKAKKRCG